MIKNGASRIVKFIADSRRIREFVPYAALIAVFLLFALTTNGRFVSRVNMNLIITQAVIFLIVGTGSIFIMAQGNMDFAQGGELVLACMIGFFASKWNPLALVPACLLAGVLISLIVGALHISFGLPTFVLGISTMFIGQGSIRIAQNYEAVMKTPFMYSSLDNTYLYITLIAVVVIGAYFVFEKMKFGKYGKAIGANPRAAFLSGIPVDRYKLYAFLLSGICVGVAAILYMIKVGSVTRQTGSMLQINILICLVLGGMSPNGGSKVKIQMIVIGALIMTMVANGMTIWGLDPRTVNIIEAVIFLTAVGLTYDRSSGIVS